MEAAQQSCRDDKLLADLGGAATAVTQALNDLLQHIKKGAGPTSVRQGKIKKGVEPTLERQGKVLKGGGVYIGKVGKCPERVGAYFGKAGGSLERGRVYIGKVGKSPENFPVCVFVTFVTFMSRNFGKFCEMIKNL